MKKIFFFFPLLFCFSCIAQTETSIHTYYNDINKHIQESIDQGYEGPLYNNHWETNKNGKSWPAVGNYNESTDFWYDDDPDHLPITERNPKNVLVKVTVNRKASHLLTNEEYLFKDGRLLFYFSSEAEEGNAWETRIWFNAKGVMFKSSVKENGKELTAKDFAGGQYQDFKPKPAIVMENGKKYQELFVKSM